MKDQVLRKKPASPQNTAAALGILKALDPLAVATPVAEPIQRKYSEDNATEYSYREREEKKERKGFWERATERGKDKDREKERQRERERREDIEREREREQQRERQRERERREEHDQNELTRMIGAWMLCLYAFAY